jgi:hypothetical protein
VNALVYKCGDISELALCIQRLWKDRELYGRMAAASTLMAAEQDMKTAAFYLADADSKVHNMGPRTRRRRALDAPRSPEYANALSVDRS